MNNFQTVKVNEVKTRTLNQKLSEPKSVVIPGIYYT